MMRLWLVAIGFLTSIFVFACQKAPEKQAAKLEVSDATSLVDIMQALSVDMGEIAEGIWMENHTSIREASLRIANHPQVTEKERILIQKALGNDFAAFAAGDQLVHRTALELADVSPGSIDAALETYERLQQGCVSCHSAFRSRVAANRTDPAD